jgi:hypothetical protein
MKPTFQREPLAVDSYYANPYAGYQTKSLWGSFISFCAKEDEKHHFGWVGLSLAGHGCLLTPITLFAIILTGNLLGLWMAAAFSMTAVVIVNLAGLSTKYTIPVLMFSTLVNIGVIAAAFILPY